MRKREMHGTRMGTRGGAVAAALAIVGTSAGVDAAAFHWNAASGTYSTGANWTNSSTLTTGTAPGASDAAQIINGGTIDVDGSRAAERLLIGLMSVTGADSGVRTAGTGTVTVGTGDALALGRLYPASSLALVGSTLSGAITQTGGAVTVATQTWIGGTNGTSGAGATGTYNLSGGTVTFAHSAANTRIGRNGSTGIVNHSGGTWTSNGMFVSSQTSSSGAHSTGTYNASGTATMSLAGRLYVSAANLGGDSAVAVSPNGTFNVTGSGVTINTYGYVQGADGTLNFVADTGGLSTINVSLDPGVTPRGETNLASNLSVNLAAMTATPSVILLVHNTSVNLIGGTFGNAAEGAVFGSYELTYAYVADGDSVANDVALTLVPEPSSAVLFGAATLLASGRRRRRRA